MLRITPYVIIPKDGKPGTTHAAEAVVAVALLTGNDYKKLDRLKEAEVATSSSALVDTNGLETLWVAGVAEMAAGSPTRKTSAEEAGVSAGASTLVDPDELEVAFRMAPAEVARVARGVLALVDLDWLEAAWVTGVANGWRVHRQE